MFDDLVKNLDDVIKMVENDLQTVKTGRAKPSLIEQVQVEAYPGTRLPLVELAGISAPDPHMLTISPWDKSILKAIVSGIAASDLHLNPVIDGDMIRISIPPLTEERRLDLVKLTKQKIEGGKEMMREIRSEKKKAVEHKKGEADVSEDDIRGWLEELQQLHDEYVAKLDALFEQKEKELMAI
jgi:ribosome recycling factor